MPEEPDLFEVSKSFTFEAAHSLKSLPEGHKCKRLHGHSYRFDVVCRGGLDERGMVIDFAEISAAVDPVVKQLDHRNLDDLFDFPTTAENLARWLYQAIELSGLYQIRVFETAKTCAAFPAR